MGIAGHYDERKNVEQDVTRNETNRLLVTSFSCIFQRVNSGLFWRRKDNAFYFFYEMIRFRAISIEVVVVFTAAMT